MARPYTGNADAPAKGKRPGMEQFAGAMEFFFGLNNIGTFNVRLMRSAPKGTTMNSPGAGKWMSVHATGRAVDLGWKNRQKVLEAIDFLEKNADTLGIEEIHDYFHTGPAGQWGRGWRCNRNGKPGWKIYDAKNNAGTPGGKWIHVEISPEMADSPAKVDAAFKKIFSSLAK